MPRLTLLLPASPHFAGVALPASLARVLGRADRARDEAGAQAQLSRQFRLLPDRWSPAALTRVVDASLDEAAPNAWLRADPAHIRPDINGARLLATGDALGIGQADVDALLPALRPLFGDAGVLLDAPHPSRWYLRLPRDVKLPAFVAPEIALGDDVFEHDPFGAGDSAPEARRWRVLASEAQVLLHNHPHNAVRAGSGRVPINSLWFWGGGLLPDSVASHVPTLYSDDVLLHGIARVGKIDAMPLNVASPNGLVSSTSDALVDLRRERDARTLVERWLLPSSLVAPDREVMLDFADCHVIRCHPNQRWRFWRKDLHSLEMSGQ